MSSSDTHPTSIPRGLLSPPLCSGPLHVASWAAASTDGEEDATTERSRSHSSSGTSGTNGGQSRSWKPMSSYPRTGGAAEVAADLLDLLFVNDDHARVTRSESRGIDLDLLPEKYRGKFTRDLLYDLRSSQLPMGHGDEDEGLASLLQRLIKPVPYCDWLQVTATTDSAPPCLSLLPGGAENGRHKVYQLRAQAGESVSSTMMQMKSPKADANNVRVMRVSPTAATVATACSPSLLSPSRPSSTNVSPPSSRSDDSTFSPAATDPVVATAGDDEEEAHEDHDHTSSMVAESVLDGADDKELAALHPTLSLPSSSPRLSLLSPPPGLGTPLTAAVSATIAMTAATTAEEKPEVEEEDHGTGHGDRGINGSGSKATTTATATSSSSSSTGATSEPAGVVVVAEGMVTGPSSSPSPAVLTSTPPAPPPPPTPSPDAVFCWKLIQVLRSPVASQGLQLYSLRGAYAKVHGGEAPKVPGGSIKAFVTRGPHSTWITLFTDGIVLGLTDAGRAATEQDVLFPSTATTSTATPVPLPAPSSPVLRAGQKAAVMVVEGGGGLSRSTSGEKKGRHDDKPLLSPPLPSGHQHDHLPLPLPVIHLLQDNNILLTRSSSLNSSSSASSGLVGGGRSKRGGGEVVPPPPPSPASPALFPSPSKQKRHPPLQKQYSNRFSLRGGDDDDDHDDHDDDSDGAGHVATPAFSAITITDAAGLKQVRDAIKEAEQASTTSSDATTSFVLFMHPSADSQDTRTTKRKIGLVLTASGGGERRLWAFNIIDCLLYSLMGTAAVRDLLSSRRWVTSKLTVGLYEGGDDARENWVVATDGLDLCGLLDLQLWGELKGLGGADVDMKALATGLLAAAGGRRSRRRHGKKAATTNTGGFDLPVGDDDGGDGGEDKAWMNAAVALCQWWDDGRRGCGDDADDVELVKGATARRVDYIRERAANTSGGGGWLGGRPMVFVPTTMSLGSMELWSKRPPRAYASLGHGGTTSSSSTGEGGEQEGFKVVVHRDMVALLDFLPQDLLTTEATLLLSAAAGEETQGGGGGGGAGQLEVVLGLGQRPRFRRGPGAPIEYLRPDDPAINVQPHHMAAISKSLPTMTATTTRAAIPGTLHRVSLMKGFGGDTITSATIRAGSYVTGNARCLADLLHQDSSSSAALPSLLVVGARGSGKTCLLREVAAVLSEGREVVVVDTRCDVGGDHHVPHPCLKNARRMVVPDGGKQHEAILDCVQHHTVDVVVVDEIRTAEEAEAVMTCIKDRGVAVVVGVQAADMASLARSAPHLRQLLPLNTRAAAGRARRKKTPDGSSKDNGDKKVGDGAPVVMPFDAIIELDPTKRGVWTILRKRDLREATTTTTYTADVRSLTPTIGTTSKAAGGSSHAIYTSKTSVCLP